MLRQTALLPALGTGSARWMACCLPHLSVLNITLRGSLQFDMLTTDSQIYGVGLLVFAALFASQALGVNPVIPQLRGK